MTYGLVAIDGADDDGGTLYVLHVTAGRPVLSAAWPQPLERFAADQGATVEPVSAYRGPDYGPDDFDDERELLADLMAAVAAHTEG